MNRIALALILMLAPIVAQAQNVQQSGQITPGHTPVWVTSGVVKDAGPATAGNVTEFGITRNGGLPFCISTSTGLITGTPYDQMCLSVTLNGAARLDVNSKNGAASIPMVIAINGTPVFTSGSTPAQVPLIFPVTSGTTASPPAVFDVTVAWQSAAAASKTTTIAACNAAISGFKVTVKDEIGNSATFPITTTPGAGTIEQRASYTQLDHNFSSITVQCDGISNWMII